MQPLAARDAQRAPDLSSAACVRRWLRAASRKRSRRCKARRRTRRMRKSRNKELQTQGAEPVHNLPQRNLPHTTSCAYFDQLLTCC
eukprot:5443491-Pleurochrysis_carterae.AAC.1